MPDRFARYRETVLHFEDGPSIDLRTSVTARQRSALRSLLPNEAFAVITAFNPGGVVDEEKNRRRHLDLLRAIEDRPSRWIAVEGCSPDRTHCEASVAVSIAQADALSLARDFHQDALFWYDGEAFWLLGAVAHLGRIRLPRPPEGLN